jgi:hypothetical protein
MRTSILFRINLLSKSHRRIVTFVKFSTASAAHHRLNNDSEAPEADRAAI